MKNLLVFAVATTSICFVAWRSMVPPPRPEHVIIVHDRSLSAGQRCAGFVGIAVTTSNNLKTNPKSTLSAVVSGSVETANEPHLLPLPVIPHDSRRIMEGRVAQTRKQAQFVHDLTEVCRAIQPVNTTPIFLAIRRALEHARSIGDSNDLRYVYVQSDLQETANSDIQLALGNPNGGEITNLPAPLDNRGVDVRLCGFSATVGVQRTGPSTTSQLTRPRTSLRADRLKEVWTSLFSEPTLIRFSPFCPIVGGTET